MAFNPSSIRKRGGCRQVRRDVLSGGQHIVSRGKNSSSEVWRLSLSGANVEARVCDNAGGCPGNGYRQRAPGD